MPRFDMNALKLFAAVARHRNFRRAATELAIPASTVSERLRGLEDDLGVRLFNRTTRSVALTGEGRRLLDRISDAIATIDGAVAAAEGDAVRATLRINGPAPAIDHRLTPLLLTFLASHPEIRVEIVSEGALVDIVAAGFDAGVRYGESLAADMIAVSLGADQRQVVVGSPAYFAVHGRPASPEDLMAHRCLGILLGPGHLLSWSLEKEGRTVEFVPAGPLVTNTGDLQREAARAGLGLANLFEEFVAADLAAGTLETVLDDWCPPFRGPFLYYPERRLMPAGLRAFVDHVRAETARSARLPIEPRPAGLPA